ncbi:MAG: hypothetical protein WBO17_04750 [Sphingorhabdus sp.]
MQEKLQQLAEHWIGYKIRLVEYVGLTNDAMHVHGSLLILFLCAIVLRRRPDNLFCWLIVLLAELFNEYADLQGEAPGEASIEAGLHDLYNTMFWPTLILIMGRFLFPPRKKQHSVKADNSGALANQTVDQAGEEPASI